MNDVCNVDVCLCVSQQLREESETRSSSLRVELSAVRESLQQGTIEKQLMDTENKQLADALNRVRLSTTDPL